MDPDRSTRPLGISNNVALTQTQLNDLRTLAGYDFGPIRHQLLQRGVMPAAWIDEAILEFRRFFGMQVVFGAPLPMFSRPVDEVWHTCLLFSRFYADLCQQVFRRFIHHEPELLCTAVDETRRDEFWRLYEQLYGPPGRMWRFSQRGE